MEQTKNINVETIMKEIRQDIAARGEKPRVPRMDEVMSNDADDFKPDGKYSPRILRRYLTYANQAHNIPYYQMIPKGGLKSFIKRAIRRVVAFLILPLRDQQNTFNARTVQTLMQLEAYTLEQNTYIKEVLNQRIKKQELAIKKMSQRLEDLEKKQNKNPSESVMMTRKDAAGKGKK